MPSLKDLRNRIGSVKSTRKITSAMKMVAASKLKRAQDQAQAAQPYAQRMAAMLQRLAQSVAAGGDVPRLLSGTGSQQRQLLIVVAADRGLAGGFNGSVVREARRMIGELTAKGRKVEVITVGRKARELLRRDHADKIVKSYENLGRPRLSYSDADQIAHEVLGRFEQGTFDVATVVYNRFKSVVAQVPTRAQLVPFSVSTAEPAQLAAGTATQGLYSFEPSEEEILETLLPRNVGVQLYGALLDSAAGEQAARMTAMDNATRNAGDMINKLTLNYNRARQAYITKELIEIISGAQAV